MPDQTSKERAPAYGKWIGTAAKGQDITPRIRLFCFPYAGAGASIFRDWFGELPLAVEICPVQPPGREERWMEPAPTNLSSLVEVLSRDLHPLLNLPFAFFGHSMGALIAFELARRIRSETGESPLHLFVSGSRAPQIPDPDPPIHDLPDFEFVEELRRLNGIPEQVLLNNDFMQMILPTIRADITLCETYKYSPEIPLYCPITAYGGTEDKKTTQEQLAGWIFQTQSEFTLQMYPGDHFFLLSAKEMVWQSLSAELSRSLTWIGA